ncbi:hypothetical protein A4H97_28785 [Niastella yeongjuensis]|uniref:WGR domain-containing protein n=1 Tax=Niastella yeongjuensis TaxID=354355 RepID=A0A1V9ET62_9BACT|nr:hypothetical protein [Niastella yeongjuensis]OQP49338.1 hypothetical protein A4H97_28785 [Niastella yeongjuensis]SEP43402.1 hypothetical protein SAMN05660816_06098 [Niastella yeongjuensis]
MRLVKQSILYFKEGNSDKVYEIDLCDVGNDKYVVNFRYGRRYSKLKEGSKTPVPVTLADAEKIFNEVEAEKTSKGYSADSAAVAALQASTFTLNTETTIGASFMSMPEGRNKGILQRLYNATQGNISSHRTKWKLSRIIWKAGEYKIPEAAQYIIKLFNNGDLVHQYSCTWALARCGNETNVAALQQIFAEHTSPVIKKIAGAGLLRILQGGEKEQHLKLFIRSLPETIKAAVEANHAGVLDAIADERITNLESHYNWLETLYLLSTEKNWMRAVIKKLLLQAPLKPVYFKHIRAVFKQAELLDDFEITGMLALRFERHPEFFKHTIPAANDRAEVYLPQAKDRINPNTELRKGNSRLAYSQRTRKYLRQRVNRRLQMYGELNSLDYVKLATGILIAYNKSTDFKEAYTTSAYKWNGRNYTTVKTKFPQNAHAVFMHQILSGEHPELKLVNQRVWRIRSEEELLADRRNIVPPANTNDKKGETGLLKKISGIFGKKKEAEQASPPPEAPTTSPVNENGTPFLHLWNKLPQSYVQLLMEAQMDEIHEFAQGGLLAHPQWNEIKGKLDKYACKKLLLSPFDIPAAFGLQITLEKFAGQQADADLVIALLNSRNADARNKGKEWAGQHQQQYLQQSDFIKDLLFATHAGIFNWGLVLIAKSNLTSEIKNAVIGKAIAEYMAFTEMTPENEAIISRVTQALVEYFYSELHQVPLVVIEDLMQHDVPAVLLFGLQVLRLKQQSQGSQQVNRAVLFGLLEHPYEPIREVGLALLNEIDAAILLQNPDEIILCCVSPFRSVRRGIGSVMARLAQKDRSFGEKAADLLMPFLLRKETSEGLHDDVGSLLCNELGNYLQNANKELALNLLYGNYAAAQGVGLVILEKYTDPAQLTIPQVIALGGHENLQVRTWCWNFYKQQAPRIKFEKDAAIKLLDSKWADTRQFAMQFFREQFTENDWTPEALIALADSVKPDIEAYGRELITKFFTTDNGTTYLLKLTQHPSERMQLFATNYLERFAADDVEKIQSLEFYFRSVLTRVNKSRIAKNRIYHFLLTEGRKSEAAAKLIGAILSDVSAIAAIGDKAKCIEVLLQLRSLYEVQTPLLVKEIETR